MEQQANRLNIQLTHSVQAIKGMLEFANYDLNHSYASLKSMPDLVQEGDLYYLKDLPRKLLSQRTQLSGAITGIGQISKFSPAMKKELAMANALTPAFVTAKQTNPEVTWFYYISKNRFVNIFPWVSREVWRYSDHLINRKYFTDVQHKMTKGELYWSSPFSDSAGTGLTASLATGVSKAKIFTGALVIDINLTKLTQLLPAVNNINQGFILLNQDQHILLNKSVNKTVISPNSSWSDIAPMGLKQLSQQQLQKLKHNQTIDHWFIQKQILPINHWVLIKYQTYPTFIAPLLSGFLFWVIVIFSGLVIFIILIYWLTKKTFIRPTTEFIQHIENCAQGDPGKIKSTPDWQHWFNVVEDIFSQNRSLMQQLKDKNIDLDKRVKEKTRDLVITIEQHQRDYALLRSVMNAMPEMIIFSDGEGKLIGCNLALENFIQKSELDILGKQACLLLPKLMGEKLDESSKQAYQDHTQLAVQQILKTEHHTFELVSRRFFNDANDLLGTINIFRDVTKSHAIQNALKQAKNQAENANKAKGQFLANMSHEIRTPLNAIQGMMYLLQKTPLNRAQQQYLSNAESASKSLLYLIDELLDLAKIEAGKMPLITTEVVIDQIIDKALKLNIGKAHDKKLPLHVYIDADVPETITSDEVRLVQVLTNLLNNAIKFTHQGEVKLHLSVITSHNKNYLNVSVTDSGIGIPKSKQAHLFNAFTQADESMTRKYGGSGLGLSICRQIINLLGGNLQLESEAGQGSKFSFYLPITAISSTTVFEKIPPLHLITFGRNKLSSSLIVKQYHKVCSHQHYEQLNQIESFNSNENNVLLITQRQLIQELDLFKKVAQNFDLVALCIPMLSELNDPSIQQLEQLEVPWSIIEKPYYRVIIKQIAQSIRLNQKIIKDKSKPALTTTNNEDILAPSKILLVEDNLVNQLVAQELLKSMGQVVIIANNGQEAIDLLLKNDIDLILMDIQMPVMDGLTATKKIRAIPRFKNLPIIAMTAHAREEDYQKSFMADMNSHIAKPVTYELLLHNLKIALQK